MTEDASIAMPFTSPMVAWGDAGTLPMGGDDAPLGKRCEGAGAPDRR
ncbi:hypothetical protein [Xanthomonas floridensis]|nr:hypothetical protein [Xanthomonas floridensis]MEA5130718.1 hypothetical protein [Xanthomonas floridensis]